MKRVMMVGSAEESGGGVSSVIKLIKKMPVWEEEKTDVVYPNIIVIMDEAFSDLAVLGEVNAS